MPFTVQDAASGRTINDFGSGSSLSRGDLGNFTIQFTPESTRTTSVEFFVNGSSVRTDTNGPFTITPESSTGGDTPFALPNGNFTLSAVERDSTGALVTRTDVTAEIVGSAAAASGSAEGVRSEFEVQAEAEGEAETEIEAEVNSETAGGALASSAVASAFGANAITQTAVSGSIDLSRDGVAERTQPAEQDLTGVTGSGTGGVGGDTADTAGDATTPTADVSIISSEAEAETEIEIEAEVEVGPGAASAVASGSGATAATGTTVFTDDEGAPRAFPGQTTSALDVASSTFSSVSAVGGNVPTTDTGGPEQDDLAASTDATSESAPITDLVDPTAAELRQADSEAEVEVESEAEAEAETGVGVAAAAAAAGSGSAVSGEFGSADTETTVRTSVSTSAVTEAESTIFAAQPAASLSTPSTLAPAVKGSVFNALNGTDSEPFADAPEDQTVVMQSDDDDFPEGFGQNEAEAEAEAEVEVEAEVDNGAAAVSVAATGGAGATGVNATSLVSTSGSAATSTADGNGAQRGRNDVVETAANRASGDFTTVEERVFQFDEQTGELNSNPAEAEAEAEANAEVNLEGDNPNVTGTASGNGLGDAVSSSTVALSGTLTTADNVISEGVQSVQERPEEDDAPTTTREVLGERGTEVVATAEAIETEREAEAEAEVEVEVGFNAAAAGAGAVASHGGNSFFGVGSEAATATSVATSVGDNGANGFADRDVPGPTPLGEFGDLQAPATNPSDFVLEIEVEAEAEAEVGIGAGAAAAAAGAAGQEGIEADVLTGATTNAAAAASASGANIEIIIELPEDGEAGVVRAFARAFDPAGGGVAVAVAVAGLSLFGGLDNEAELEAEGLFEAIVEVRIDTRALSAAEAAFLFDLETAAQQASGLEGVDNEPEGPESRLENETEVEAEAEAEAGFGVAAAGAAAASAGLFSDVQASTSVATTDFDAQFGEAFVGDAGANELTGTANIDFLVGAAGNDTLDGGASGDRIDGGDGADLLSGGEGADNLIGGFGNDTLDGGAGSDFIDGASGDDTALVGADDILFRNTSGLAYAIEPNGSGFDVLTNIETFTRPDGTSLSFGEVTQFDGLTYIATNIDRFDQSLRQNASERDLIDVALATFAETGLAAGDPLTGFSAENFLAENPGLQAEFAGDPSGATLEFIRNGSDDGLSAGEQGEQTLPELNSTPIPAPDRFTFDGTITRAADEGLLANDRDPDGNSLIATLATGPQNGTLNLNADGSFSYTPNENFLGDDSFTYTVSDGTTTSLPTTVSLTVTQDPNTVGGTAPVAINDSVTFDEGGTILISVDDLLANDLFGGDRTNLSISDVRGDTGAPVASLQDDVIEVQLPTDFSGPFQLLYTVTDGQQSDIGIVNVTVTDINDAPVGTEDGYVVQSGGAFSVEADRGLLRNDTDVEGDTLTAVLDQGVQSGTLTLEADGSFSYVANAGFVGQDIFTYFVNDGTTDSDQAVTVTIDVLEDSGNVAPVAQDDRFSGTEDTRVTILTADVLSNDSDTDGPAPAQLDSVFGAIGGSVSLEDENIFFIPDANFNGIASFAYVLSDENLTDIGIVEIDIAAVNDVPVANNEPEPFLDQYFAFFNQSNTINGDEGVLFNDTDADGETLEAVLISGTSNGTLTLNSDGGFVYTPDQGFLGTDSFVYAATDGVAQSGNTRVEIQVQDGVPGTQPAPQTPGEVINNPSDRGFNDGGAATAGNDTYVGTDGNNAANAGAGDDTLSGNAGNDFLVGGEGSDDINGGSGNDTLNGVEDVFAVDALDGGEGNDTFQVNGDLATEISDVVSEAPGNSGIDTAVAFGSFFDDTNDVVERIVISDDAVRSESGISAVVAGNSTASVETSTGSDFVIAGTGQTELVGSAGTDFFDFNEEATAGTDTTLTLSQGGGTDYLSNFDTATDQIDLSAYNLGVTADEFVSGFEDHPFGNYAFAEIGDTGDTLIFLNQFASELTSDAFIL